MFIERGLFRLKIILEQVKENLEQARSKWANILPLAIHTRTYVRTYANRMLNLKLRIEQLTNLTRF